MDAIASRPGCLFYLSENLFLLFLQASIERAASALLKDAATLLVYQEVFRGAPAQAFLKILLALRRGDGNAKSPFFFSSCWWWWWWWCRFFLVMVAVMMDNWDQVPSSAANDMKNLSKVIDSGLFNSIYSLQWGFCMHLVEMVQVCKHLWFVVVDGLKLLESYGEFFKLMAMGQHTRFVHWLTDLFFPYCLTHLTWNALIRINSCLCKTEIWSLWSMSLKWLKKKQLMQVR